MVTVDGGGVEPDDAEIVFGPPTQLPGAVVLLPTPQDVARFLRWDTSTETTSTIEPHLYSVMSMVRGYTRGVGFGTTESEPGITCREDIASVIVHATARSVTNPAQVTREEIGSWNAMPAIFAGFTLAEQYVLNTYRRRTA